MWRLTLSTNQNNGAPAAYSLTARYRIPAPNNPNQSADGPEVTSRGTWELLKSTYTWPGAAVYQLRSENRSLSFVKVGENLLHMLNIDGTLAVGDGGWSFKLNRADRAEKPVEPSLAASAPDMSYKISPMAEGPSVFGVFEGRSPCHGIAREIKIPRHDGCMKVKWRVTLLQDGQTLTPTTYKVEGTLHRRGAREGNWSIVRGTRSDPNATVYRLEPTDAEGSLLLWKADDNVLFFLDQGREPMVGHVDFSYTLNRRTQLKVPSAARTASSQDQPKR